MLYEALVFAAGSLAVLAAGLVLYTMVACRLAYLKFKKRSRGMPIINDLRLIGNHVLSWAIRKNVCSEIQKYHQIFGKNVGWLYNTKFALSTVDLDLLKVIHCDEINKHMNRVEVGLPVREIESSIMLADEAVWRKLRRHFAPALKPNKFKTPNVMHEIERSIDKLINYVNSKLEQQVKLSSQHDKGHLFNIDDLVHRYSLNLVFSSFYKQYNLVNFDDNECHWTRLVDEGLHAFQTSPFVAASILFPVLRPIVDWLSWHFHSQGAWRRDILNFVKIQTKLGMEARKHAQELMSADKRKEKLDLDNFVLKDGTKFSRNMIDYVIDQFLDGKLTKDEYLDTSCFLVGAADKTASDCLVHTLYQLAVNQDVQERLRKSIVDDGIDSEFLAWVLNESLRLMPPAPIGASRTVTRDIEVEGGYVIPKETFVITPIFAIHRLKQYWGEDAEEFKPDRWRDTSGHHPMQYLPFGYGPRGCPGKEFALFEMKMLLAALFTRYKFEAKLKEDLYVFDSPFLIFVIPNSPTYITIKKLVA